MIGCEYFRELISGLLDGELNEQEEAALADHLLTCPECAAMYKAFKELSAVMQDDMEEAPEGFCENVMAELRRAEILKKNRRKSAFKALLATAACAVLVVAAGRLTGFGGTADNSDTAVFDVMVVSEKKSVAEPAAAAPAEVYAAGSTFTAQANTAMAPMAPSNEMEMTDEAVSFSVRATAEEADGEAEEMPVRQWAELSPILGGEPAAVAELPEAPVLSVTVVHEGVYYVLNFFEIEGLLYYLDPMDGTVKQCACSLNEIM